MLEYIPGDYRKTKALLAALELDNAQANVARLSRLAKADASKKSALLEAIRHLEDVTREYKDLTTVRRCDIVTER